MGTSGTSQSDAAGSTSDPATSAALTITEYPVPNVGNQLVNGGDGNLWAFTAEWSSAAWTNGLAQITPAGVTTLTAITGNLNQTPGPLAGPILAPDNSLWFSQPTAGVLSLSSISLAPATLGVSATPFTSADSARLFDAGRRLWYAGATATSAGIGSVNFDGTPSSLPALTFAAYPTSMAAGPDGSIWFTVQTTFKLNNDGTQALDANGKPIPAGGVIGVVAANGSSGPFTQITTYALPPQPDNVLPDGTTPTGSKPTAITLGSDGNMWFVEGATPRIGMITTGATPTITEYDVSTSSGYVLAPYLALGVDGNMWFSVWSDQVGYINPITLKITLSAVPTADAWPSGLTTGPDGRMWFAEPANQAATGKVGAVSTTILPITNDNFANATVLSGISGFVSTNNINATAEAGELPITTGNTPKKSLWWSWTAPADAPSGSSLVVRTNGSSYATVVGIFTGTQLSALQSAGTSDPTLIGPGITSRACTLTPVVPGTTYQISVDGYNGASGALLMDWRLEATCPP